MQQQQPIKYQNGLTLSHHSNHPIRCNSQVTWWWSPNHPSYM